MKLTLSTIAWGLALTASAQLTTPQIELPDPLLMNDGKTQVTELKDWKARRLEIADMIQTFGIGQKPEVAPEAVKARMDGDTLIVDVTVNCNRTTALRPDDRHQYVVTTQTAVREPSYRHHELP